MSHNPALQIPFTQDEAMLIARYLKKGSKQHRHKEFTRTYKEPKIETTVVLPTAEVVAQAKSEMKRDSTPTTEVFNPIKVPLQPTPSTSSTSAVGGNTSKRRKPVKRLTQKKKKKKVPPKSTTPATKKKKRNNLGAGRDIFHT